MWVVAGRAGSVVEGLLGPVTQGLLESVKAGPAAERSDGRDQ